MKLSVQFKDNTIWAPLTQTWLIARPEEKVRQEFIAHLVNHYFYDLDQMAQEVKVNHSNRGSGRASADIVIWRSAKDKRENKSPIIVVECKAAHITIRQEDYYQGYNYASWAGADFFVTTNLKETKFFKVVKGEIPQGLDEIIELPNSTDLNNEKKIQEILNKTKAFTRDEFSKLLFKCHNIIRNNDKLSPEAAFDEISKILFMKIRYERKVSRENLVFSEERFNNMRIVYQEMSSTASLPFYQHLFEETKKDFADDEIFDPKDIIKIRENSFLQIVKELEKYNLSDTSDDVKGIAFEEFLGKTFRGELGQFFTPRTIVNYMVDILDPEEGENICDPCCGSGGFLIKAFEYVREKIEQDIHKAKEIIKEEHYTEEYDTKSEEEKQTIENNINKLFNKLNTELDLHNQKSRLRTLSYNCVFGTDANPRMARTAKMNMIMHGDGHGGVHHHDGLLNVNGIYEERFDVIVTNPPFGARVDKHLIITEADLPSAEKIQKYKTKYGDDYESKILGQMKNNLNKPILNLFSVGDYSGLTEVLFLERCLRLLKKGGRMGIVLPEGVLNNGGNMQKVRDWVEGKAKIINITSIPQDVFIASGATVKPSLVFLKKFTELEADEYRTIKQEETGKAGEKYNPIIDATQDELKQKIAESKKARAGTEALKTLQKELKQKLAQLELQREEEIKAGVKERFDYPIPIIEVQYAGISTTGAQCQNDLIDVVEEFARYKAKNQIWDKKQNTVIYKLDKQGEILRTQGLAEPEIFY